VLGTHDGIWGMTVGQRRGLGLDHHERRFVVDVDAATRTVVVGPRDALACTWLEVARPTFTGPAPEEGDAVLLQLRAHSTPQPARIERMTADGLRLTLDVAAHGVALGQAAVLYDLADHVCLGGGRITAAQRPGRLPVLAGGTFTPGSAA